ncbi:hypothetical protein CALVIDRAFT_540556 [Calocera viscosa TUFC12733]|uniref:Uncharacterized protein n=1 Tax=Calocera viscosa (strain TUFC12733) TaxID=1330018 RepID=A0A167IRB5_CALVF|nr:hypothetical protein CALVIDRAFT_540556 [Calocera viscosa TUFC12733]
MCSSWMSCWGRRSGRACRCAAPSRRAHLNLNAHCLAMRVDGLVLLCPLHRSLLNYPTPCTNLKADCTGRTFPSPSVIAAPGAPFSCIGELAIPSTTVRSLRSVLMHSTAISNCKPLSPIEIPQPMKSFFFMDEPEDEEMEL